MGDTGAPLPIARSGMAAPWGRCGVVGAGTLSPAPSTLSPAVAEPMPGQAQGFTGDAGDGSFCQHGAHVGKPDELCQGGLKYLGLAWGGSQENSWNPRGLAKGFDPPNIPLSPRVGSALSKAPAHTGPPQRGL